MVSDVSAITFEEDVLQVNEPVLVDIWAPWCGPCRAMAPTLEKVAQQFLGQARVVKLNADENPDLVRQYKVLGIPTLLYFSHGKVVDRQIGLQSEQAISRRLSPLLTLGADEAASREISGLFRRPAAWILWLVGGVGLIAVAGLLWWLGQ